jgi:hypothetical protein
MAGVSKTVAMQKILPVAVLGLTLAACSEKSPGNAQPGTDVAATAGAQTSSGPSSSGTVTRGSEAGTPLADAEPCDFLSPADIGALGLTGIEKKTVANQAMCQAKYPNRVTITIGILPDKGLNDYQLLPNAQPSDMSLGTHKAKRVVGAASKSSCAVTIGITDSSRVDVAASSNADPQQACDAAMKVATAVEPKLP